MTTARLEAFSDAVMAIIITLTALSVHTPQSASFADFAAVLPALLIYAWSFQTIGTYWNNHHHLMRAAKSVSASMMWANLHLLFWLSLIPFTTQWLGSNIALPWPTAVYCFVLLCAAIAYTLLEYAIASHDKASPLRTVLHRDFKGWISLSFYLLAILCAFLYPWISFVLVIAVTLIWLIPDRRIVRL